MIRVTFLLAILITCTLALFFQSWQCNAFNFNINSNTFQPGKYGSEINEVIRQSINKYGPHKSTTDPRGMDTSQIIAKANYNKQDNFEIQKAELDKYKGEKQEDIKAYEDDLSEGSSRKDSTVGKTTNDKFVGKNNDVAGPEDGYIENMGKAPLSFDLSQKLKLSDEKLRYNDNKNSKERNEYNSKESYEKGSAYSSKSKQDGFSKDNGYRQSEYLINNNNKNKAESEIATHIFKNDKSSRKIKYPGLKDVEVNLKDAAPFKGSALHNFKFDVRDFHKKIPQSLAAYETKAASDDSTQCSGGDEKESSSSRHGNQGKIKSFVGSNLFDGSPKKCFSAEDVTLLAIRRDFEFLIPKDLPECLFTDELVNLLMQYFFYGHYMIQRIKEGPSKKLLEKAYYDMLGGYLHYYVVPVTKFSYYAGQVAFETVENILDIYTQCKAFLNTQGHGWRTPIQDALKELRQARVEPMSEHMTGKANQGNPGCCAELDLESVTNDIEDDQMIVGLPKVDTEDRNCNLGNIWLPFKRKKTYDLRSCKSAMIVMKFYKAVTCCYAFQGMCPKTYNMQMKKWIADNVWGHLSDEQFYPGFGGILRIYETLKLEVPEKKEDKCNANIFCSQRGVSEDGTAESGELGKEAEGSENEAENREIEVEEPENEAEGEEREDEQRETETEERGSSAEASSHESLKEQDNENENGYDSVTTKRHANVDRESYDNLQYSNFKRTDDCSDANYFDNDFTGRIAQLLDKQKCLKKTTTPEPQSSPPTAQTDSFKKDALKYFLCGLTVALSLTLLFVICMLMNWCCKAVYCYCQRRKFEKHGGDLERSQANEKRGFCARLCGRKKKNNVEPSRKRAGYKQLSQSEPLNAVTSSSALGCQPLRCVPAPSAKQQSKQSKERQKPARKLSSDLSGSSLEPTSQERKQTRQRSKCCQRNRKPKAAVKGQRDKPIRQRLSPSPNSSTLSSSRDVSPSPPPSPKPKPTTKAPRKSKCKNNKASTSSFEKDGEDKKNANSSQMTGPRSFGGQEILIYPGPVYETTSNGTTDRNSWQSNEISKTTSSWETVYST